MTPNLPAFPTVIIGDLHGRRDLLRAALNALGLLDAADRWTGGGRRLILLGDLLDRGPEPLSTLDLVIRLQADARAAGGELTCLMGNHEWMALRAGAGDHACRMNWGFNGAGADLREWASRRSLTCDELELPYPEAFYAEFGPEGEYGRWLRSCPVACRVGEYVAVHAGWTPADPDSVEEANAIVAGAPTAGKPFLAALDAVQALLWARNQSETDLAAACRRLGCRALIAGHTPQPGLRSTAGGKLVQIDTGMYVTGIWTALGVAADGSLWALMAGQAPVPMPAEGFVPLAPGEWDQAEEVPPAPQYGPGALIRMYRAPDGAWRQYLLVEAMGEFYGYPAYTGRYLTYSNGAWTARPGTYPCARIDNFGRPAAADEVPSHLLN
jgi:hypothetical protein